MFAKLFDTDQGQILVLKMGGQAPEVRLIFETPTGSTGLSRFSFRYVDRADGAAEAEEMFAVLDEQKAARIVADIKKKYALEISNPEGARQ